MQGGGISAGNGPVSSKLESFGTVRARLGYAVDRVLPYVTGGFAWGNNKITDFGTSQSQTLTADGGGGRGVRPHQQLTARAEYLYTDLGKADYKALARPGRRVNGAARRQLQVLTHRNSTRAGPRPARRGS